ncbi:MAG: hypothetical protein COA57_03055 [Flavobacteriales bacterium]|nr:MAG: hypothetical protein COA57_03055 [Flavobacteriales bacterium]
MKFFITGATGFIGSHLCHQLINEGHEIVALIRSPEKAKKLPERNVELIQGDLLSFKNDDYNIPECDVVIHLAGVTTSINEADYFKYNFDAVMDLVECLNRQSWKPKRFVFASSLAAGGPSEPNKPLTEKDVPKPIELYGQAKLKAEEFLKTVPFPVTSFRPAIVLGTGDEYSLTLFKMAKKGLGIKVAGINQQISYIDVDDLNDAIIKMCMEESAESKCYFVSYKEHTDLQTLWYTLGKAVNRKMLMIHIPKFMLFQLTLFSSLLSKVSPALGKLDRKQYEQMIQPSFLCSSEKLQKELSWQPKYDVYEMTRRAAIGYKKLGML